MCVYIVLCCKDYRWSHSFTLSVVIFLFRGLPRNGLFAFVVPYPCLWVEHGSYFCSNILISFGFMFNCRQASIFIFMSSKWSVLTELVNSLAQVQHREADKHSHSHYVNPVNPTCTFSDCGRKPEYLEKSHTSTGTTFKLSKEMQSGSKKGGHGGDRQPLCTSVNSLTIVRLWPYHHEQSRSVCILYFIIFNNVNFYLLSFIWILNCASKSKSMHFSGCLIKIHLELRIRFETHTKHKEKLTAIMKLISPGG